MDHFLILSYLILSYVKKTMRIRSVYASPKPTKRFRAEVETKEGTKTIDFGLKGAFTYLDGADKTVRENYWKRHLGNPVEHRLIRRLILSPSLLSAYLIWGHSRNVHTNMRALNRLLQA